MRDFSVRGQRVVVMGAARSGVAAARLLAAKGALVTLSEQRETIDGEAELVSAGIALELGGHCRPTLLEAQLVVLSPGVSPWQPLLDDVRAAGIPVIGELELASRWFEGRLVAITGTKGKSTTTTLVGEMLRTGGLKALVGGNLGPAASLQVAATAADAIHVVEASSFQLEVTDTFRPDVAVFLNLSPDHLDRHRSVQEYIDAKARIFANQGARDVAVVNAEDPEVMRAASSGRAMLRPFAIASVPDNGVGIAGDVIVRRFGAEVRELVPLTAVHLLGRHLLADVLAATAVADALGVSPEAMTAAVAAFRGLEHALEPVATIGDIRFVNDSKATNVDAARLSIEAFKAGVVPILGGRFKGGDPGLLAVPLQGRARAVVVIGESRALFRRALGGVVDVVEAGSMREAVRVAWGLARAGETVLLAPACASFDMFRDYAERGCAFKAEVERLRAEVDAGEQ